MSLNGPPFEFNGAGARAERSRNLERRRRMDRSRIGICRNDSDRFQSWIAEESGYKAGKTRFSVTWLVHQATGPSFCVAILVQEFLYPPYHHPFRSINFSDDTFLWQWSVCACYYLNCESMSHNLILHHSEYIFSAKMTNML